MSAADEAHAREVLLEAFTAGWQAALAVTISNPRVLAVVESCFEQWLCEATDEVDVLGLPFRGREDLPGPSRLPSRLPRVPGQRRAPEDAAGHLTGPPGPEPEAAPVPDPRRRLTLSRRLTRPEQHDRTAPPG